MTTYEGYVPVNKRHFNMDGADVVDGARGGGSPKHHLMVGADQFTESMIDDGADNISMEVQLGEEGSRHPSEISSVSYQNLLEDADPSNMSLSRRDSEDSNEDSQCDDTEGISDYLPEDIERFESSDLPLSEHYATMRRRQEKSSKQTDRSVDNNETEDVSVCSDKDSRCGSIPKIVGDHGDGDRQLTENGSLDVKSDVILRRKASSSENVREVSDVLEAVKKRNSLEIRNNIPTVGQVKIYDKDLDDITYNSQGAKPKIRKHSPGLARRVCDRQGGSGSDREGSSSEREMERKDNHLDPNYPHGLELDLNDDSNITENGKDLQILAPRKNLNIENEYDYVKYARVQKGNSYVGMRLAYSSSNDSLNLKRNSMNSQDSGSLDSSRETSPEKILQQKILQDFGVNASTERVNEDSLTEIPLNGIDGGMDDRKSFTLSPENTECDSVEVESVMSDGDRSTLGMPMVDDGLSSSQASDIEDFGNHDSSIPSEILRQRQRLELEHELLRREEEEQEECERGGNKEMDAQAIMNDLKAKREALDNAIADIKSAIQRSKGVALQSSYKDEEKTDEPIWVKRDPNLAKMQQRQEEMRKVREEIERQQEEEYAKQEHEKGDDGGNIEHQDIGSEENGDRGRDTSLSGEQDGEGETDSSPTEGERDTHPPQQIRVLPSFAVYEMDDEKDDLLENQYSNNNGKAYQAPKGYDSDDEHEDLEGIRYTRRNKGKKYALLQKDDSLEHGNMMPSRNIPQTNGGCHHGHQSFHQSEKRHNSEAQYSEEEMGSDNEPASKNAYVRDQHGDSDTDEETDRLLQKQYQRRDQYVEIPELSEPPVNRSAQAEKRRSRAKEGEQESLRVHDPDNPEVLIEGVLFRARYLGSTQLVSEGQPSKAMRMMQAQEAVGRIKAPEGENQPSTDVDLFVSTEKIMVLNTDLQEIMMDHGLRTISYIADIGDILVIMARRRLIASPDAESLRRRRQAKILCHVFESDEAQLIAQSIGQAFQVAYMEFLKANGIEDPGILKEMDYQDVLNQQEIYGEELNLFANKDYHKEVIVPKGKGEPLGVVIVESGWGSMVPTVVLANMSPIGPAARCGQLNIGDQIISINGISLVGLPLSACQAQIKTSKPQTVVKLTVVPCPPVVEVLIKRPDVKYQLGFSVQNGVICSLLRGGIAERGGVRVGHRIIEINNQSVVAVPHEKIVALLANSVGEIHMKTMPTSIYRLLTGQDTPHYL